MLIVGGGYIGLEIAGMYQRLGSQITIVELMDQLLPGTETDLVRLRPEEPREQRRGDPPEVEGPLHREDRPRERGRGSRPRRARSSVDADIVLVSVGRRPVTRNLNLEKMGIEIDPKGYIKTDQQMRTNVRNVFAIGDVSGMPLLAHKAQKEGIVAAEAACRTADRGRMEGNPVGDIHRP